MKIEDMRKEPVELSPEEQRKVTGGIGPAAVIGLGLAGWAVSKFAYKTFKYATKSIDTDEVVDSVISGSMKAQ